MTLGGQWLEAQEQVIKELFGRRGLAPCDSGMSAASASTASGEVFAFTADSSPDSSWNTVEGPMLDGKAGVWIDHMPHRPRG